MQLVLSGVKRPRVLCAPATRRAGQKLPTEGALIILEDGAGNPVAVLETTEVTVEKFADIDDAFARAYGEWGGSLEKLAAAMPRFLQHRDAAHWAAHLARIPNSSAERFHVIFDPLQKFPKQ